MKKISFVLITLIAFVTLSMSCKGSSKPVSNTTDSMKLDSTCVVDTINMVDSVNVDSISVME